MGSITNSDEEERGFYADEAIFVAVGNRVEQSERALLWAIHYFVGKRICLLHVHRPSKFAEEGKIPADKLKQYTVRSYQELEHEKLHELMDHYQLFLTKRGVLAFELFVKSDNIEKGIVETIARHDVKGLVMGAAADECYHERLAGLKSKKALFVCQEAARFCRIWFVCKGHLIYTREEDQESSEIEFIPPLVANLRTETNQSGHLSSDSTCRWSDPDIEEDSEESGNVPDWLFSQCSVNSNLTSERVVDTADLTPWLAGEDQQVQERKLSNISFSVEQANGDITESKRKEFGEAVKWRNDEDDIVEAKCKAKAFQSLYVKEISHGKQIEEAVGRVKREMKTMQDEHDELTKELHMVKEENLALESQIAKSQDEIREWSDKYVSAVDLLISFKDKRDKLRVQHKNAVREVEWLRRLMKGEEASSFSRSEFPVFSFLEISEATNDFDPSWKISEGKNGTVYRGILRQMDVAVKMLPSYGSRSQSDFQRQVGIISRIRHPNLATLIGMCPESWSLVYEYLKKRSLEDCLGCKDNTIPWQIRMCIATEICSALIFLHSNKPCVVHGNLKPSNILLDANYTSKLGGLGIVSLIPQNNNPNGTSLYMDPEYLETGELRPESDVYSFGLVLLRLLTGRPIQGLVKDVQCVVDNDNVSAVLDLSAGDWPVDQAKQFAQLALRCCSHNPLDRPCLASQVLSTLKPMKASCIASPSNLVCKKLKRTPSHFVCPILQEIMEDPQIAADGFTYESEAIRGWLDTGHNTSPMTNLKLDHLKLVPNYALHNAILEWQLLQQ